MGAVWAAVVALPSGAAVALSPGAAAAQLTGAAAIFQADADSLRHELRCEPDTAWPPLPANPEAVLIDMAIDSAGALSYPDPGTVLPPAELLIPQYAYLYDPTAGACEPVIVLEARDQDFVYARPNARIAGRAPMVYFDLLGETPPASRARPDSLPDG